MRQQLAEYRVFWRQFRQAYNTTGAVAPSGRRLSRALAHYVRTGEPASAGGNPATPRRILEVGPGTGAVTTHIAQALRPNDQLTLVERNEEFVGHLQNQLRTSAVFDNCHDRVQLVHASLEDL